MTIKDFLEISKTGSNTNTKNTDFASKYCSRENKNSFMDVLEQANKNSNVSFNKEGKHSYNNYAKNDYSKNSSRREFNFEHDNSYNKFYENKNAEISVRNGSNIEDNRKEIKDTETNEQVDNQKNVEKTKEDKNQIEAKVDNINEKIKENESSDNQKKAEESEENKNKSELKSENTEETNTQENTTSDKSDKTINLSVLASETVIKDSIVKDKDQAETNNAKTEENPDAKTQIIAKAQKALLETVKDMHNSVVSESKTPKEGEAALEELTSDEEKQQINQKTNDKQPENVLQQPVKQDFSSKQIKDSKIISENKTETQLQKPETTINNEEDKAISVAISEKLLNTSGITQVEQPKDGKIQSLAEKLAELNNKEDSKAVITQLEVKSDSSKMDMGSQNNQQELKSDISQTQNLTSENNIQKMDLQKTAQFDKILNSKQSQSIENSILNQIKDKISSETTENKSQINIILKPENLGKVNINIISQNGTLTAQITAENSQTKDILNKNLETLRQTLTEQGVQVGKMVVQVQESPSSNQNMNSENGFKEFDQANSGLQERNYQSGNHNKSGESSSAYSNSQLGELDEMTANESDENNILTGHNSVLQTGRVDYKV